MVLIGSDRGPAMPSGGRTGRPAASIGCTLPELPMKACSSTSTRIRYTIGSGRPSVDGQIWCVLNVVPSDDCWPSPGPGLRDHVSISTFGTGRSAVGIGNGSVNGYNTNGLVGKASIASAPGHGGSMFPGGQ